MAEYKVFHCPYGDDFEGGDECDRCEQYELCMETPNGDVIERSKIDKAIEEIEKTENTQEHIFYDGDICARGAFNDGMEKALEILKRNIGEDKENE
jgi:hypothetical protein